jgi:hypothetical protein
VNIIEMSFLELAYSVLWYIAQVAIFLAVVLIFMVVVGVCDRWNGGVELFLRSLPEGVERWQPITENQVTLLSAEETILMIRFRHGLFAFPPSVQEIITCDGLDTRYQVQEMRKCVGGSEYLIAGKGISSPKSSLNVVHLVLVDFGTKMSLTFAIRWQDAMVDEFA